MAENFKSVRRAKILLGRLKAQDLTYFNWEAFTGEEYDLCPPVVTLGGDGAMYDIGFQNLSRLMMSGKPIKVVILDTQSYSNTGGQACTSSFMAQEADMATYGPEQHGKVEARKEIGLIALAHRTSFFLQSGLASTSHLIEGVIRGLKSRRPAVFNLYSSCQPEHGIADDASTKQAKLALESRAYPYFSYDPDLGDCPEDCLDLSGNTDQEKDWRSLEITQEGETKEVTFTFADFAATEGRFKKHFHPLEESEEEAVEVAQYLDLDLEEKEEVTPFIWVKTGENWQKFSVSPEIIESAKDRRNFWRTLQSLAGLNQEAIDLEAVTKEIQSTLAESLKANLLNLAKGEQ